MNKLNKYIPEFVKSLFRKTSFNKKRLIRNKTLVKESEANLILNEAPLLSLDKEIDNKPRVAIIKTQTILEFNGYIDPKASWLRYERFCKHNNIPYSFYDITKSNWLKEAVNFDIFVCHTPSTPAFQEMIESKIYILEKILGKHCFPSFYEVWQYEDKNRSNFLYQAYNLPTIPTYVSYNKKESLELADKIGYPFITKTSIGAGSSGVFKISTRKQAKKRINKIFGVRGLKTQFKYQNQKDYFYIQKFIDDATYDLRIMLVGNKAFGYYRYPKKGDFRASGSGVTEKKEIPQGALKLAIDVRDTLKSRQMGVDLLYSQKDKQYYIIETSLFNQIDTPIQFALDGVPGYYDISDINNITFKEGKYWIQELVLRDVVNQWSSLNC